MNFSILYRGPLQSCNYACRYCPFAKLQTSQQELEGDRRCLQRFTGWLELRTADRISVMFAPWGEALIHPYYQKAIVKLSLLPQIEKVVIQTNLSGNLAWVKNACADRLALWCSFHPGQAALQTFLDNCLELECRSIRFSVGAVALHEHKDVIVQLRRQLPARIYFWLNAYKHLPDYYMEEDLRFFESFDPFFQVNTHIYSSHDKACFCGESVVSITGSGDIQRCFFIKETIGNIYTTGIETALKKRLCTNPTCHCYIGYVHLKELNLYQTYGDRVLERIPQIYNFS